MFNFQKTKDTKEERNNDNENLLKLSHYGNYVKCTPEFEVEDLKLTSI